MRAFVWFLALIVLAGVLGAVIAYPTFELVSHLGGVWAFHRVASRIAMLVLIGELWWLCRHLSIRTRRDFGYGLPWRVFSRQAVLWGLIGMATAGLGAVFLLGTDLRIVKPNFVPSLGTFARLLALGLSSGIAVALIEETVMRGAIHTAIQRESGPWTAALLTAPVFAILHFFARVRIPPEEVGWGSGFDLLSRSFAPLTHVGLVADSFLSWLAIGLLLSLTRVLTGNIAVALGLHAGWVLVLRVLLESTQRGTSPAYSAWVGQFDGLLGYWLLPWSAAIALAVWLTRGTWVPYARASGPSTSSR